MRDGQLERLPKPGKSLEPLGIAAAPDGSAWYTDIAAGVVSRMTPAGEVASFAIDTPIVRLGRLAVAPDGAAWFAEAIRLQHHPAEGRRAHPPRFESPPGGPYGVAVADDGTVWATLQAGNQLLRITPDGAIEAFNLPRRRPCPTDIAIAPDGAVWFVEFRGNRHRPVARTASSSSSRSQRRTPDSPASRSRTTARCGSACCAPAAWAGCAMAR